MGRNNSYLVSGHRRPNNRHTNQTYYGRNMARGIEASYWRIYKKCFPEVVPHRNRDTTSSKYHRHKRPVPYHFYRGRNHTSMMQRKNSKVHPRRHQKRIKPSSETREVHNQVVEVPSFKPSEDRISTVELKKNQESIRNSLKKNQESIRNSFQTTSISSSFVDQDAFESGNETPMIFLGDDVEMNMWNEVQGEILKDDCCGGGGCGSGCGVCPGINRPPSCGYHTFLKEFVKANCKLSRCEAIKNAKCIYAQLPECTKKLWRRRGCCKRREVCKRRKSCGPCGDEFILQDEEPEDILSELGVLVENDEGSSTIFVADPVDFGLSEEEEEAVLLETHRRKYTN